MSSFWIFPREVEEVNAGEDDEETAEERDGVDRIGRVEALEEDEGRQEGKSCKCHIIKRVDTVAKSACGREVLRLIDVHVGTELAQCLVEVVHLRHDCCDCDNQEDIGARMCKLVAAAECELERNTKTLDSAN